MSSNSKLIQLWQSDIVIDYQNRDTLNNQLLPYLLDKYKQTSLGKEHYERIPHNIFADNFEPVNQLKELLINTAKNYYDIGGLEFDIEGHEIVSHDRQFIKTHVDTEEGDLTFQYYVKAPKENEDKETNSFGNASFVLVNPARPAGSFTFKNEHYLEYPILPKEGLLIMYRSYIPHYQNPYEGNDELVQVVANIKFKRDLH